VSTSGTSYGCDVFTRFFRDSILSTVVFTSNNDSWSFCIFPSHQYLTREFVSEVNYMLVTDGIMLTHAAALFSKRVFARVSPTETDGTVIYKSLNIKITTQRKYKLSNFTSFLGFAPTSGAACPGSRSF
jgi:hypothetical protein